MNSGRAVHRAGKRKRATRRSDPFSFCLSCVLRVCLGFFCWGLSSFRTVTKLVGARRFELPTPTTPR